MSLEGSAKLGFIEECLRYLSKCAPLALHTSKLMMSIGGCSFHMNGVLLADVRELMSQEYRVVVNPHSLDAVSKGFGADDKVLKGIGRVGLELEWFSEDHSSSVTAGTEHIVFSCMCGGLHWSPYVQGYGVEGVIGDIISGGVPVHIGLGGFGQCTWLAEGDGSFSCMFGYPFDVT